MDYGKLVQQLTAEMKKGVQFARMRKPFNIFAIIAVAPLIVTFILSKIGYWFTLFFYKMIATPASHLHQWMRGQKDEVHHATQAVLYYVCLPLVFGLQVLLSFNAIAFFIQWFFLMLQGYLLTLGGIRWQPFITEAKFDEEEPEYEQKPSNVAAYIVITAIAALLAQIVLVWLVQLVATGKFYMFLGTMRTGLTVLYAVGLLIVNPCLFKRIPKE